MVKTDLSRYNNSWFRPMAGSVKRLLWYLVNAAIFNSNALLPYSIKCRILRIFGAKIGKNVVIKPRVNIKYPWKLVIGDYTWIGEGVWIDNLDFVRIESSVCLSQGAMLLSGNHDFSKSTFDLIVQPIEIKEGAWIGAKSIVTQGVTVGSHAILAVNSVASNDLNEYAIYRGNPCVKIKDRVITE